MKLFFALGNSKQGLDGEGGDGSNENAANMIQYLILGEGSI